jgi:hypothetical protein
VYTFEGVRATCVPFVATGTLNKTQEHPLMPSRSTLQAMWRESGLACFKVDVPVKMAIVPV